MSLTVDPDPARDARGARNVRVGIRAALVSLALLLSSSALAAPKLTLLFTGDNGGQVAPCG